MTQEELDARMDALLSVVGSAPFSRVEAALVRARASAQPERVGNPPVVGKCAWPECGVVAKELIYVPRAGRNDQIGPPELPADQTYMLCSSHSVEAQAAYPRSSTCPHCGCNWAHDYD